MDDPKKALSDKNVTPLFNTGPYRLGMAKPSDPVIRFRNEKTKTDDEAESSNLNIYDSAGPTKL